MLIRLDAMREYAILATIFGLLLSTASYGQSDTETVSFNIPSQTLPNALNAFARQAKVELVFAERGFDRVQTRAVVGSFEKERALELLLAGTGLRVGFGSGDSVIVQRAEASEVTTDLAVGDANSGTVLLAQAAVETPQDSEDFEGAEDRTRPQSDEAEDEQKDVAFDEIIVTGTSIRGVIPESSPLTIYDAQDIRNTGAATAEAFVSTLPQNNNTLTAVGSGASTREANTSENNSADIRGLGVGTTLVLLNGRRMAPAASGRAADLSFIPLAAVERVEVLTDGASAVYGADAVGGVVNFVLKDQQEGAESVIGYGAVDGGREQLRLNQSFGFNWIDGDAFVALSYMDQNDLDASDRDYSQAAVPRTLVGEETRTSALATIAQRLPGEVSISGDLLYSTRELGNSGGTLSPGQIVEHEFDNTQTVVNVAVERPIGDTVKAELLVTHAEFALERVSYTTNTGARSGPGFFDEDSSSLDVTAKFDGELARLGGGAVRFSLGAGYSEEEIEQFLDNTLRTPGSVPSATALSRDTKYAFAELFAPIISPEQGIRGIRRLELNLAARYTDYSDLGENTSPKIGVLWSPAESLKIRGTYSESFKAPFLVELAPGGGRLLLFPPPLFGLPDIWSNDGSSSMLLASGAGKQGIGPEEAQTYSFGFDFDLSGLTISATYFNIDYTDRIASPDPSGGFIVLSNPQDFPSFFNQNLTVEQITTLLAEVESYFDFVGCFCQVDTATVDPATLLAATTVHFDNRLQNLAVSETDGLDLSLNYTMEALGGDLSFGVHASKTLAFDQRAFKGGEALSVIDTVLFPADFKARTYVGLQREQWNARLNVNYVDDYDNPFDAANPTIDSWTTADLMFSYEAPTEGAGLLDAVRFSLSVLNVLDEDPPFVPPQVVSGTSIQFPIGFDPANANPFGRAIDFQVSKRW